MTGFDGFRNRLLRAGVDGGLPGGIEFAPNVPIYVASASGRLDVMGGSADFCGSLAAATTIGECARVALQRRTDAFIRVASREAERAGLAPIVEVSLADLAVGPHGAEGLRRRLTADPAKRWAAKVIGCYLILLAEKYLALPLNGASIVLESDIPAGAGVSSSAAVEVAAMAAINAAYCAGVHDGELSIVAQKVDFQIVGAPCGTMDHLAVANGRERSVVMLLCRPNEITGFLHLPDAVHLWGIDSGIKHSASRSPFTRARVAAFMGRRIVNHRLVEAGEKPISYLCELTPNRYRRDFSAHLPAAISGEEFLTWLGETGDPATRIDPSVGYAVRASTEHAIYENHRAGQFVEHLTAASKARSHTARVLPLLRAGELMHASHWSYTRIGLGSRETSLLVKIAREMGPARGIYGAKISGKGAGGTVALLTAGAESARQSVDETAARYADATGLTPRTMEGGAAPGALAAGVQLVALPG
jgi:galactokinase